MKEEQQTCKLASEQLLSDFKRISELAQNIMINICHLAERLEEAEIINTTKSCDYI